MSFKIIKVGRAKDNDIVLTHSSVSRYHCELFYDGNGNVFLTDKNYNQVVLKRTNLTE